MRNDSAYSHIPEGVGISELQKRHKRIGSAFLNSPEKVSKQSKNVTPVVYHIDTPANEPTEETESIRKFMALNPGMPNPKNQFMVGLNDILTPSSGTILKDSSAVVLKAGPIQ